MLARVPSSLLLVLLMLVPAAFARAEVKIYTFIDESGERHYTDQPDDNRYRLMINPHRDRTRSGARYDARLLARASIYDPIIERAAASQAIEANLLRAVIVVESGFNSHAVSARGAIGLMQLMPSTARRFGVSNLYDPSQNVVAGASYLKFLIKRFGNDVRLALAAYNAGEDAVDRSGGRIPPYSETQAYVPRVLGIYQRLLAQTRTS
jgi:soluble lytic murein transglycosylase-like protein